MKLFTETIIQQRKLTFFTPGALSNESRFRSESVTIQATTNTQSPSTKFYTQDPNLDSVDGKMHNKAMILLGSIMICI